MKLLTIVDEPEPDVSPMSAAALQVMMEQNHEQAEEGHHRLRTDYRELEQRVLSLERMMHSHALQLSKPTDVTTLQFPARLVVALVMVAAGLGAGQYALNTRLEANVMKTMDQNARLWDERFANVSKTMDGLRNRMELLQIEVNQFQKDAAQDRRRR